MNMHGVKPNQRSFVTLIRVESALVTIRYYLPIVGMVVTISPNLSLYRMVVLPAASSPTIKIRTCLLPNNRWNIELIVSPILDWIKLINEGA